MRENTTAPGTPALMRAINDRAALAIMLDNEPLSRNQLSELSDVSKPTASQMVRRLESAGLIEAVGKVAGTSGPNTELYGVRADRVLGVALDIQSDRIFSTVVDAVGHEFPIAETFRPLDAQGRSAALELTAAVSAACLAGGVQAAAVSAICVGLQASVSPRSDELLLANELPGWPTTGTRARLEDELHWTVDLHNDANLAAVAERAAGAGNGAESFALLWLGVGLGFAVDLDGRLLHGAHGAAGEIGTLRVPGDILGVGSPSVLLDELLNWSVLEEMAARHGIHEFSLAATAATLQTHPAREDFFAELAPRVAIAIPPALAVLDPELIVLGGPIGAAGGPFLAGLVQKHVADGFQLAPQIVGASITTNPVLAGACHTLTATIRTRLLDEASSPTPRLSSQHHH